jgi:asparagine synthetase B (glutamine-hydrolysing)
MWAFAIWDMEEEKLFCARDRFGIKPFYYRHEDGQFIFGSEIKQLLVDKNFKAKPNDSIIYDFMISGLQDHTSETFFENIYQLMPAHYITLSRTEGLKCIKYWQLIDKEIDFLFRELKTIAFFRDDIYHSHTFRPSFMRCTVFDYLMISFKKLFPSISAFIPRYSAMVAPMSEKLSLV